MRVMCLTLVLAILLASTASAEGGTKRRTAAMADDEDRALAARAAESPDLERFEAGSMLCIAIATLLASPLIVFALAILYVWISGDAGVMDFRLRW